MYILLLHLLLAQWKLRDSGLQARILLSPEARQCVFWLEDCVPEERDVIAGPVRNNVYTKYQPLRWGVTL